MVCGSTTIPLDRPLPNGSSCQPGPLGLKRPYGDIRGHPQIMPRAGSLFGIAPGGACHAGTVTSPPVGSYPTVSPLPRERGGLFSVALSVRLPCPGVTRHRCFRESGLSSDHQARGHPALHATTRIRIAVPAVNGNSRVLWQLAQNERTAQPIQKRIRHRFGGLQTGHMARILDHRQLGIRHQISQKGLPFLGAYLIGFATHHQ